MNPAPELTPVEDLDRNIHTLCTHINAATYESLVLIREFDERAESAARRFECLRDRRVVVLQGSVPHPRGEPGQRS